MNHREKMGISRWDAVRYWLFTRNCTRTGVLWVASVIVVFVLAGLLALQMRYELASPASQGTGPEKYAELFSLHGTIMIFFVAVPVFFGVSSAILPRVLRTDDVSFSRANNLDLWLIIMGASMLEIGYLLGQRPAGGWTGYAPLSLEQFQPGNGMDWWIWGIFLESLGTGMAAVDNLTSILRRRHPDIRLSRMPLFAWSMFFTSLLAIVAVPFLLTALMLLFLDRNLGLPFYTGTSAESLILWQDLFWFYSHPATYIMLLPAFGIVSAIISRFSGRPLFSYVLLLVGTAGVWVFSYLVWYHHMFTTGLDLTARTFASVNTWGVSLFSGIVVFTWLASLWRARIRLTVPMLWALGLIFTFTIGGADGVYLAFIPVDEYFHDSYWLVAHFHYIIMGTTIFGLIAAIYYWFPLLFHRQLSERLGRWHFWLSMVTFNLTFFPMHILGVLGMQRRIWTYPDMYTDLNVLVSVAALAFALTQFLFLASLLTAAGRAEVTDEEAWGTTETNVGGPTRDEYEPYVRNA